MTIPNDEAIDSLGSDIPAFKTLKHALVTFIGVILLVYVILASDVIPELNPFKPRSVVELRIREVQGRHGLSAQQAGKLQTPLPKALLPHNNWTHHPPTKTQNVFHFPPEDPPPSASGSRASANQSTMVPPHRHSSGSNNNNSSRGSSSDSKGQNVVDTVNNSSSENVPSNDIVDSSQLFQRDGKNDKPKTGDSVVVNMKQAGSREAFKGGHSEETVRAKDEAESSGNRERPGSSILLAGVPKDRKVFLTVGMVTVKRDKADYFSNTLGSLLQHCSPDEQRELTIVVMLADRDQARNDQVLQSIKERYHVLLQSGLLLVIRGPNSDFIFSNSDVKRTYDSLQQVRWRSKQNLDYAAVIEFCANLSTYYLHVEDDVLSADSYIRHIRDFINANKKVTWAMLEVCRHGFIGKLFKTVDLPKLVTILRTFYLEQPCDFLIDYFVLFMTQAKRIVRPSPLFYHQGKYSSQFNVTRKVDKVPGNGSKKVQVAKMPQSRANPMAEVSSDLKIWDNHGVYNAYSLRTSDFLWASDVTAGQRYTVTFVSEQRLKKLVIDTGFSEQDPRDRLYNGRVDMGTKPPTSSHPLHCPDAKTVGKFQEGHFDVLLVPPHGIRCFSVVITDNQKEWLIIREIQVYTE